MTKTTDKTTVVTPAYAAQKARRELQAIDSRKATADYETKIRTTDANTARLKALRLAKTIDKDVKPDKTLKPSSRRPQTKEP